MGDQQDRADERELKPCAAICEMFAVSLHEEEPARERSADKLQPVEVV